MIEVQAPSEEVLAVHEALDRLEESDPLAAKVVKLKYFVGMTHEEISKSLEISVSTVERYWSFARSWLRSVIRE